MIEGGVLLHYAVECWQRASEKARNSSVESSVEEYIGALVRTVHEDVQDHEQDQNALLEIHEVAENIVNITTALEFRAELIELMIEKFYKVHASQLSRSDRCLYTVLSIVTLDQSLEFTNARLKSMFKSVRLNQIEPFLHFITSNSTFQWMEEAFATLYEQEYLQSHFLLPLKENSNEFLIPYLKHVQQLLTPSEWMDQKKKQKQNAALATNTLDDIIKQSNLDSEEKTPPSPSSSNLALFIPKGWSSIEKKQLKQSKSKKNYNYSVSPNSKTIDQLGNNVSKMPPLVSTLPIRQKTRNTDKHNGSPKSAPLTVATVLRSRTIAAEKLKNQLEYETRIRVEKRDDSAFVKWQAEEKENELQLNETVIQKRKRKIRQIIRHTIHAKERAAQNKREIVKEQRAISTQLEIEKQKQKKIELEQLQNHVKSIAEVRDKIKRELEAERGEKEHTVAKVPYKSRLEMDYEREHEVKILQMLAKQKAEYNRKYAENLEYSRRLESREKADRITAANRAEKLAFEEMEHEILVMQNQQMREREKKILNLLDDRRPYTKHIKHRKTGKGVASPTIEGTKDIWLEPIVPKNTNSDAIFIAAEMLDFSKQSQRFDSVTEPPVAKVEAISTPEPIVTAQNSPKRRVNK